MGDASRRVLLDELEDVFAHELAVDRRAAAEVAYALAFLYRNHDIDGCRRFDLAKLWATRSVEILDSLPSDRLSCVVSGRTSIAGVLIPEILHAGVVRSRLSDVLI